MKNINQRGITLIALVVTIIVLIILAGISINFLLGDNGIIKKAQDAGIAQQKAELIEKIKLKITEKRVDNNGGLFKDQIEDILDDYGTIVKENDEITGLTPTDKDYTIPIERIYSGTINDLPDSNQGKRYVLKTENGYDTITGGWEYVQSPEDNGRCQTYDHNTTNGLYLYGKGGNGKVREYWYWAARNAFITVNPIDLSNYTTMHVKGHAISTSSYTITGSIRFGVSTTKSMNSIGVYAENTFKYVELASGTEVDESYDLSTLDSNTLYYVYLWHEDTYYNTDCGFTADEIWFE